MFYVHQQQTILNNSHFDRYKYININNEKKTKIYLYIYTRSGFEIQFLHCKYVNSH